MKNIEVRNKLNRKRGRSQQIIQEIKLQEPIERRGGSREEINTPPENDQKYEGRSRISMVGLPQLGFLF